ncbi:intimin-like inverse autotransporter SinH [Salmonella enterica]|uniref:intimin-like inverse autotransporter SinH n=6 Tax=Salmonella enterica TaxID=28901 RepID=UPI0039176C0B
MVRRIRILVLLLVSGVSVAASGADNSVSANDESHSSLPDLASESAKKEEQENKGKTFKEQGANYFINSATQGFDNLTPEALESQARGYIQGQVTSSAQSYLEGMLSPYGKVRTSLSIGEGGDLDGSSLDYFIPWYDNQSTLFFSQISAQRKEDRTIGNVGLGVRQNVGNWLLGGNAFYDYDFTRGHRRLGLGTEAWTDYLKFSGNYYHPLSDWKDSKDFDFYEERPARGWDIRMESWLPFYPQLGAKLVYEQYYGDEVALFGTDNLQKDPHAVTVGLNYTPVPLVTVGTDYKAGTGDSNDFSVNATVNYQIGTPLAAQLDPENVKIQHSLMGSRTDFVDRNNFIVLEYREKDPLDVTLWLKADATNEHPECVIEDTPEAAVGLEKCKWTVNALINHHYKIISASWQAKNNAARTLVMPVVKADALTEGNNNRWNLVLPAWVNADTEEQRTALNTWKVRMTLEDEKGNKQNSGVVEITVQQDRKIELIVDNIADTDRSDHSHEASALADGEDGVVMDLLITDSFERPKLADEVTPERTQAEANETWARVLHPDAAGNPDKGGCAANRLPRIDQLEALYNANSDGVMKSTQGWPTLLNYWSSTFQSATTWKLISLFSGSEFANANVSIYASCLASDNPAAASITIEPVDASQWYDGSGVHAVKAKKGDTMQLKVTVKDASGNPIPEAPFVLTRGDGYDRKGEKYTASEGDDLQGIVTPVVIDGESLAWTTTKMGMLTGADGTRIISVTRPDTHGTRTAIIATLYENAAVSASIDTIFTVITSPDVDVARMWGHMLPSLTAADGAEYQRPQLYAELANQASAAQYTEDNEIWAGLYGPGSSKTDPAVNCAAGYFPSIEALDSLYSKYPNRTIKTAQGWPINRSYWSGSSSWSLTGGKPRSYYTVDLDDDSRRSVVNDGVNDRQYQICATTPKTQATQITLTSTLATDDTIQAVKAKNSESIPLLVTTTDAAGNPVPYTTFSLKRDAGTPRKADYPFTNSYTMTMTQSGGATQEFAYSSSVLYGATGANGTLALSLDEPGGVGVKSVVTASLYDTPTVTSSLPAVFTVITSPNSDRANMYGHMPETFTASNGAKFTRPLLYGELSSQNHTSSYFETNETWFTVNNFNTGNYGACPINQMATQDDLQSLYRDHPKGKITTDIGLPIKKKWWAGDSLVKNQSIYWQFTDLNTGNGGTTLETPGNFYYQLCLTEPRQMKIALSTDVWNADKSAAVAKTGEAIPMTVTVTNGAGQPQAGATVMLTRDYSYSRGTVDSKYIQAGVIGEPVVSKGALSDMTLTPVSPAGAAVVFNNQRGTSTKWYGVTGDDGKLRFTLNQDKSLGLRTSITATLSELAGETASVDAIFTVPTSPDTPYASYWGHMPDTVEVNGVTLRRPFLKTEMSKMPPGTWPLNNETWAANYIDYGETSIHATTSLPYLCGSLENAATLDDLKALKNIIGDLHWPTAAPASSYTYDYASQTMVGGKYCSFNETTNTENCTLSSQGFAYASCRVQ